MWSGLRTAYVLDDETEIGMFVRRSLEACGLHAVAFDNPANFLANVRSAPPQVIILDLALGRSDAIEIMRRLEEIAYQGDVLLMSGRSIDFLSEVTKIGIARGLSMLPPLTKPFRQAELRERLGVTPEKRQSRAPSLSAPRRFDLGQALREGWTELWYQPKVDLKTLRICGAEALVRIQHPEFGTIQPGQFLPPTGDPLYQPLSNFVMATAISDWKKLAAKQIATKIAVNMPVSVVLSEGFVPRVRDQLPGDGSLSGLIIEITEDEILRDTKTIREVAMQLRLSSIDLSIDDFGTAHASLARLRDLPCSELKLDRSFVSNCASDKVKLDICRAVRDLAKRFGVTTCAEGIETKEDLQALAEMGFDCAQGYLFAKPMRFDALVEMMGAYSFQALRQSSPDEVSKTAVEEYRRTASGGKVPSPYVSGFQPAKPLDFYL
jgi:EAL domain-containing protein (putative c-di-GMP-specific phosphodiesterase class I)